MQSSSLHSWTVRIFNQLSDALSPSTTFSEIDPTEALHNSLSDNPSWTLLALAHLIREADQSAVRTLALVLLKRFPSRRVEQHGDAFVWAVVPVATQKAVLDALLESLLRPRTDASQEELNSLCKCICSTYESEVGAGQEWPGLHHAMVKLVGPGATETSRQLYFTIVFEAPVTVADVPVPTLLSCLEQGLKVPDSTSRLPLHAIKGTIAILSTDDRAEKLAKILPHLLQVYPQLCTHQNYDVLADSLTAFLDMFSFYNETDGGMLLVPYLSEFFPFVTSLVNPIYPETLRKASIEVLVSTAESTASATLSSHREMYQAAVRALLQVMQEVKGEADDEAFWSQDEGEAENEDNDLSIVAEEALDRLSAALGASCVLQQAIQTIPQMTSSQNWKTRYAGLSALAVLAEGNQEEYLQDIDGILQLVLPSLADPNYRLVYAAIYAIAELCEHLKGTIQRSYGQPILEGFLVILANTTTVPARLTAYTCAAIVNYTDGLQELPDSLLQHSMAFFQELHSLITNDLNRQDVKLRAMGAIAQLASALGENSALTDDVYKAIMHAVWRYIDGDVSNEIRSSAMNCATLVASSAAKAVVLPDSQRLITSLMHIQQTHTEVDDPCTSMVLIAFVRVAEILGSDFLPYVDSVIPSLLRLATYQPVHIIEEGEDADNENFDEEVWHAMQTSAGRHCYINGETMRQKLEAFELMTALSHALGNNLAEVGTSETPTGEWISYAETTLILAGDHLGYEYRADIRTAVAAMLPVLVRSIKNSARFDNGYTDRLVSTAVPALLAAVANEADIQPLSAVLAATTEIIATVPHLFSVRDATVFANACVQQIDELKAALDTYSEAELSSDEYKEMQNDSSKMLESMTPALQAFIKLTGSEFPFPILADTLSMAVNGQLLLDGSRYWALRLIVDLMQYGGPSGVAWTADYLNIVHDGITDADPQIRRICAFGAGIAAVAPDNRYTSFYHSCIAPLEEQLARGSAIPGQDADVLAHDNVVSALCKITTHDPHASVNLPLLLRAMPVQQDVEEMETCFAFLLDLIAKGHPAITPSDPGRVDLILSIFTRARQSSKLSKSLSEPLNVGLHTYLAECTPAVQNAWAASIAA